MTTSQKLYIRLIKRPIGFLGALVALILLDYRFTIPNYPRNEKTHLFPDGSIFCSMSRQKT